MDTDAPVAGATLTAAGKRVQKQADGRFTLTGLAGSPRLLVHASAATYGANVALVQLPAWQHGLSPRERDQARAPHEI